MFNQVIGQPLKEFFAEICGAVNEWPSYIKARFVGVALISYALLLVHPLLLVVFWGLLLLSVGPGGGE